MSERILIIDGHPDPDRARLIHAMADAYAAGAREGGHEVREFRVAELEFPLLRSSAEFEKGEPIEVIAEAQEALKWASHIVIAYPLWLGTMPALLKGFLEQVLRPGVIFEFNEGSWPVKKLKGRSARIIVTMGMPVLMYRWYFWAHSLKSLQRSILKLGGIGPIRDSLYGMVETVSQQRREDWLRDLRELGRNAK